MRLRAIAWIPLLLLPLFLGCAAMNALRLAPVTGCDAVANATPICGFQNPEDLVALPGDEAILVSEYGSMEGDKPGALAVYVRATEQKTVVFRGGQASTPDEVWGDASCPGPPPPAFSPHGIHLRERPDGRLQLLVVQHGGRESIEFFEVTGSGAAFEVSWRGCVVAPEDTWLNSVAGLPEGGFVTTHMMSRSLGEQDLQKAFASGTSTGYALEWVPERGFRRLLGTDAVMPNGIEVSSDGSRIFLNTSGNNELRRIVRATGEVEARAEIPALDNARWAPDGRLLVASLNPASELDFLVCMDLDEGACPIRFMIVAVDPASMQTEILYENEGPPMGGGTVGLQIDRELYIGSFAGDRILRVALD